MRVSKSARGSAGQICPNDEFEDAKARVSAEGILIERDSAREVHQINFPQRRSSAAQSLKVHNEEVGRGWYIEKKFGVAMSSGAAWYRGMLTRQLYRTDDSMGTARLWEVYSQICYVL